MRIADVVYMNCMYKVYISMHAACSLCILLMVKNHLRLQARLGIHLAEVLCFLLPQCAPYLTETKDQNGTSQKVLII